MRTRDISWLAGLLEGEGCFSLLNPKRGRRYPRITLSMTDEDVVRRAHSVAGVGHVNYRGPRGHRKPVWTWEVSRQSDAAALMMTLYPLLGERRQARIREVLDAWRMA